MYAEVAKAVRREENNFMSKKTIVSAAADLAGSTGSGVTQRDQIRKLFVQEVVLQRGQRKLKCFRSKDAPALTEYKTLSELESNDGRGNPRNFEDAYDIYQERLAVRIPTSASELEISLYIASMLELPVGADSPKRTMTSSLPDFLQWITLNGCKLVAANNN